MFKKIGVMLLKVGGMLLFFWVLKYLINFIFGNLLEFLLSNYWLFVLAGLIPAFIAECKGISFWPWWIIGTLFPILSTVFVLGLESSNEPKDNNAKAQDQF